MTEPTRYTTGPLELPLRMDPEPLPVMRLPLLHRAGPCAELGAGRWGHDDRQ